MYKIGIIGDKESVMGFMALGYTVYETEGEIGEAVKQIRSMVSGGYAIIYITEEIAEKLSEEIKRYKTRSLPAIITIPGRGGSTGYGMMSIRKSAERATGIDLFK